MKKILLLTAIVLLLTGCGSQDREKFTNYLANNQFICKDNVCSKTTSSEQQIVYINIDLGKDFISKGYALNTEGHIQLNFDIKKDILYTKYTVSDISTEVSYHNSDGSFTCEVDEGLCKMLKELTISEYLQFDKMFVNAGVNKDKI